MVKNYNGYIIDSGRLHTKEQYDAFQTFVSSVPFDGKASQADAYYADVRRFLYHLLHNTLYTAKEFRSFFKVYVPVSYELGIAKLPYIFDNRRGFTRGLDQLVKCGLVQVHAHNHAKGLSRRFKVSDDLIKAVYGAASTLDEAVPLLQHRIYQLTMAPRGVKSFMTLEWLINRAEAKGAKQPFHDLSEMKRDVKAKVRYTEALSKLRPHRIKLLDLYKLILEHQEKLDAKDYSNKWVVISRLDSMRRAFNTILDRGIRVLERNSEGFPTVIEYFPTYFVAAVGGRMFEKSGFQTLPSDIKWLISEGPYNYDMVNCQFIILRSLLDEHNIETNFFDVYENLQVLADKLNISKEAVKLLTYGTIFNAGEVRSNEFGQVYRDIKLLYPNRADAIFRQWKQELSILIEPLKELTERLLEKPTVHNQHGRTYKNAAGTSYTIRKLNSRVRRRILAHVIQGYEAHALLRTLENGASVCALEHDGFIGHTTKFNTTVRNLVYEVKQELKAT